MTVMDWKEKYDEAIRVAKNIYTNIDTPIEVKDHLASIFPELSDSEDERIRKMLIDQMLRWKEMAEENHVQKDIEDSCSAIAWLEKQKEGNLVERKYIQEAYNKGLDWGLRQKEQKPTMIQWTGDNLKEVIDFTGKSPKFDEWFKSWDEYEEYVHSHNNILKLFCEDGSHYEVPVGSWIVKTPDGFNIPSQSKFVLKPAEWSEEDDEMIDRIATTLSQPPIFDNKACQKMADWVRSLRPRLNEVTPIEKDGNVVGVKIPVINKALYFDEISKEEMKWDDAMAYAKNLGRELPSKNDAYIILYYLDEIKKYTEDFPSWWWTSTQSSSYYSLAVYYDGSVDHSAKYNDFTAVPLADLNTNS